jgi:hypothetical protein
VVRGVVSSSLPAIIERSLGAKLAFHGERRLSNAAYHTLSDLVFTQDGKAEQRTSETHLDLEKIAGFREELIGEGDDLPTKSD